jgi:hypothetical protein
MDRRLVLDDSAGSGSGGPSLHCLSNQKLREAMALKILLYMSVFRAMK